MPDWSYTREHDLITAVERVYSGNGGKAGSNDSAYGTQLLSEEIITSDQRRI
jgi:hypothetical protein